MKRQYNRVKDSHDPRDHHYKDTRPLTRPPVVDLSGVCSPVRNQGDEGCCTGEAWVGAYEYEENLERQAFFLASEQYVYYNERVLDHDTDQDAGAEIRDGIKAIVKYGVCSEALWPLNPATLSVKPSLEAYAEGAKHTALQYASVDQTENAITHALAAGHPVVFGITVYDSFESDEVAANGLVPMPDVNTEQCQGGHAVLIVGYDYHKRLFKVRNSWGPDWGDHGYFYLPFEFVFSSELCEDFWVLSKIQ
ncbi:MAG: C1 family peptidase [Sulfuriferula sp.]|nr:C1 family peptidase [Sulfuriferula sp.]